METKTPKAALVLMPPEDLWRPIQDIRRLHDRQFRRWMPHVSLLYPFRPREQFDSVAGPLGQACRDLQPREIQLVEFRSFEHARNSYTMWLAPEPADWLRRLQQRLLGAVPDCDDVCHYPDGFTPHLSVGQAGDAHQLHQVLALLRDSWRPLRFRAEAVSLIWRGSGPPDDVFRVDRTIPLGPPP